MEGRQWHVPHVLFVDDEEDIRIAAEQTLSLEELPVTLCASAEAALEHVSNEFSGVLVTDIRMPGMDGTKLMDAALEIDPDLPVILITGHGDVDLAVQSMRNGAYDFIEKPFNPARLVDIVRRGIEKRQLVLEVRRLRKTAQLKGSDPIGTRLIGQSDTMRAVRARLRALAETDTDILIEGATGTGKEIAAQALHDASHRSDRPFLAINCAALPEALIETELFGHTEGAFPGALRSRHGKFEHARGGTIFLDQIDCMPLAVQAKLLSVIQDRAITPLGSHEKISLNIRIIAAASEDLQAAVAAGRFRADLLYRLNVATVEMPNLNDRREDIPSLLQALIARAADRHSMAIPKISAATLAAFAAREWPGNVRELNNAAERLVLGIEATKVDRVPQGLHAQVAAHEKSLIAAALRAHNGSIKDTYTDLGISRKALYEKMQKHGLIRENFLNR